MLWKRNGENKNFNLPGLAAVTFLAAALAGCGGTPYSETGGQGAGVNAPQPGTMPGGGSSSGGQLNPGFSPSYSFSFSGMTGKQGDNPDYTTGEVNTDSHLVVQISADQGGQITTPDYEEFNTSYGCAQFGVDLINLVEDPATGQIQEVKNGQTKITQVLKVPGADNSLCPDAASADTIDFSSRLGGQNAVKIRVKEARYDLYCQLWMDAYQQGLAYYGYHNAAYWYANNYGYAGDFTGACPGLSFSYNGLTGSLNLRLLHEVHTAAGNVDIQVNGY